MRWELLTIVPYTVLLFTVVRPLIGRLTTSTPVIVAGVLSSSALTEWMGLHLVFGAFLFGLAVPRTAALGELRVRVGHVGALLLPVYFVIAGLEVDLSTFGLAGLLELGLILLVAVAGKFAGVYGAARLHRLDRRETASLATLLNTRGFTELVILAVGLELGVLDRSCTRSWR
ncbi:cation:proton antiporter [Prauserella flavalba]|uniref:Cation/H+ exchanger transmembrane domain-containing protein n=1 Tax=Prauserella flavalba TaxID=1477506 RepID=A0A318LNM4_9PSEU|nr:cation:proton antiporter [Prauserella flavalba]PXY20019.1 hypothetical protein BA062_34080 [Prauserella flavalba]